MPYNFALRDEYVIFEGLGPGFLPYLRKHIRPEGPKIFRVPSRIPAEFIGVRAEFRAE